MIIMDTLVMIRLVCPLLVVRSLHICKNEMQDCSKIAREPMDKLTNLTCWCLDDRSLRR